jgi:hypothetical protein
MHRVHHQQPKLSWIELRPFVEPVPHGLSRWLPQRDIQLQ